MNLLIFKILILKRQTKVAILDKNKLRKEI